MKRIIAVLMCAVLVLCTGAAALAADEDRDPIVYVTGYMNGTLTKNLGKADEEDVMFPQAKIIAKAIAGAAPAYTTFRITDDYRALANAICEAGEIMFDGIRCDENGNSVYDVSLKTENIVTDDQPYGKCNYFYYDWRNDVNETAKLLDEYINDILNVTGKEKVALICRSMGGCIGAAYITKFGHGKLSSIIMSSSAAMGVEIFADMLCGTLDLKEDKIYDYLLSLDLLNKVDLPESTLKMINAFGYKTMLKDIAKAVSTNEDILHKRLVVPILSRLPGVWSFVKQNKIAACKVATGIVKDSALEKKIDSFLLGVRPMLIPSLHYAKEDGVKLAILSAYNSEAAPSVGGQTYQSDNLIATSDSSMGAVCASLDSSFDESYNQRIINCHYHVSPDRIVDASTCAFPDNTWFMKDAEHPSFDPKFVYWVAYTNDEVDVYSNEKYPQFLQFENGRVTPMEYNESDILPSYKTLMISCFFKAIAAFKQVINIL